jgi:hypothetical protein
MLLDMHSWALVELFCRALADANSDLDAWTAMVRREKAVYHTLNKMSMDTTAKVHEFHETEQLFFWCQCIVCGSLLHQKNF